jgi:glycine dehydrogenase
MSTHPDRFVDRHIGPREDDVEAMLKTLSCHDLDELIARAVPASIRLNRDLALTEALSEVEAMSALSGMAGRNRGHALLHRSGLPRHDRPGRSSPEHPRKPGWYTQYTPYQAEIAQGRLEALLNFQTLISSLTGLDVANASMLDEGTAAAEAMTLCARVLEKASDGKCFFVSDRCHPQTIALLQTRAAPLGIEIVVGITRRGTSRRRPSARWCSTQRPTDRFSTTRASPSALTKPERSSSSRPTCWR